MTASPASPAPSVDRRRLRRILRTERDAARMTQDHVATIMEWSLSKVIRIESGAVKISTNDLRALLDLYNVPDDRRTELLDLARASRRPPWWSEYREYLTPSLIYYIGLEPNAASMQYFHSTLIPGIVQTIGYARASIIPAMETSAHQAVEDVSEETLRRRLNVRMRRQAEFFQRVPPPRLHVILDEAALRRVVGGHAVMREQMLHLIDVGSEPHVTIQVIPFTHGMHIGTFGPYIIIDFPDPDAVPVLYLEGAFGGDEVVKEKPEVIELYRKSFEKLQTSALSPEESLDFIKTVADGFA